MNNYKTVFIPSELIKSSMGLVFKPNGDQLARDIQASISEQSMNGYKVFQYLPSMKLTTTIHLLGE